MNSSKIQRSAKKIPWLAGIFAVQLVLAVVLFNVDGEDSTTANAPLLAVDTAQVDKLEITSGEESLQLLKKDNQWQLGDGLPAAQNKVGDLLKELGGLRGDWPVATTADAAKRFEVSDEKFKRKIRLLSGDKELVVLYMGTSPSFKQAHLRKGGSDAIYAARIDEFALGTNRDSWLDPGLMRPQGDILALQIGEHKVAKADGKWPSENNAPATGAEAPANPTAPAAAAPAAETAKPASPGPTGFDSAAFAKALADVSVLGVAPNQADFDAPAAAGAGDGKLSKLEWSVTTSSGNYQYQLLSKDDQYFIRRNDNEHSFRISKLQYDALAKIQELQQSAVNS